MRGITGGRKERHDAAPVAGAGRVITGITTAKADPTATTYRLEVKIPWISIGVTTVASNLGAQPLNNAAARRGE